MATLLADFSITTIVLVLLIGIPSIVNFIKWCKNLWQQREQFKQDNIEKGKQIEAKAEAKIAEKELVKTQIEELQKNVSDLTRLIESQEKQIQLLIDSDELSIKAWIKVQHETWMPLGCIDGQTFELLEQRFKIYTKEGGNSWAEKLVNDLRQLPVVTVIPITDIHEQDNNTP